MLETDNLCCVRGERTLFAGLRIRVEGGNCLQVAGENGAGKSSLLRILVGLLAPAAGEVRWNGEPIGRLREAYWETLAYVGHLNGIKDDLSALENLMVSAALAGTPAPASEALAALERVGLASRADLATRQLSQGQKRRVAIARLCLAPRARLWILDEPFNALDTQGIEVVAAMIAQHVERGGLVVLTSHLQVGLPAGAQWLQLGGERTAAAIRGDG
ncbi:MAG TPA: cytochrome c biogenesis heme-transporting ATPase CcmA [Burkholderiaceae bacterium]|nr:cytochrome c biogenesis heme-transporting ATPase CcmA [Burkholderiaceae bacterium]